MRLKSEGFIFFNVVPFWPIYDLSKPNKWLNSFRRNSQWYFSVMLWNLAECSGYSLLLVSSRSSLTAVVIWTGVKIYPCKCMHVRNRITTEKIKNMSSTVCTICGGFHAACMVTCVSGWLYNPATQSSYGSSTSLKTELVELLISLSTWVWSGQPAVSKHTVAWAGQIMSRWELVWTGQPVTCCFKT